VLFEARLQDGPVGPVQAGGDEVVLGRQVIPFFQIEDRGAVPLFGEFFDLLADAYQALGGEAAGVD
jgi:hypothetical protein